jgi:hypothetical protein
VLARNGCERVGEPGEAATVWAVHLGIVRRRRTHSVTGSTSVGHQAAAHVTGRAS